MLCKKCSSENPETNRFCGQCGSALATPVARATPEPRPRADEGDTAVLSAFHEDVARQQSELQQMRGGTAGGDVPAAPPLSKLATATVLDDQVSRPEIGTTPPATRETAQQWFSPPQKTARQQGPIAGPSFLGLSDSEEASENAELAYLYEDEPKSGSRTSTWIAALIVLGLVGFMAYEWHQNPSWQSGIVGWAKQVSGRNPSTLSSAPATTAPVTASAQESSHPVEKSETPPSGGPSSAALSGPTPAPATVAGGSSGSVAVAGGEEDRPTDQSKAKPGDPSQGVDAKPARNEIPEDNPTSEAGPSRTATAAVQPQAVDRDKALVTRAENYLYGRGVAKNCDQALVFLRAAADRGSAAARSKLGGLYATGNCVPLDRARAYNWFSLARQSGDRSIWVERNMGMLWGAMSADERTRAGRDR